MWKKLFIVGWILGVGFGVGCASDNVAPISAVATPTTHPIFRGSGSVGQPVDNAPMSNLTPGSNSESSPEGEAMGESAIHTINVKPGDAGAILTWTTDNPTIGYLAYGLTEMYELGTPGDDLPLMRHAVILDNLEPETTYYYRITAVDSQTNAVMIANGSFDTNSLAPIVEIWYGLNQKYGNIGIPQQWFNVFGNVSDKDGVASLTYSLNGGLEKPLSIGPDLRRLAQDGDFNADIHRDDLLLGENEVVIKAADSLGYLQSVTVTVNYEGNNVWPGNYSIDWQTVSNVQDVAQIADGNWKIDGGEIRIAMPNYDRLVAIGDIAWTDYEVEAPITLHSINDAGFNVVSGGPAIGLLMRWTGHTDTPISGWQPKVGWMPFGAIAWYWWKEPEKGFWQLEGTDGTAVEIAAAAPQFNVRYIYKLRVETTSENTSVYSLKVWQDGQTEPLEWKISEEIVGPPNGSLLLLAHQVDASFGNVTITQLAPPTATPVLPDLSDSPVITNTLPITSTLPITGTIPITGTGFITETTSLSDEVSSQ